MDSIGQSVHFMPIPSCFYYCSSIIELDIRDGDASGSSFIVQDCFGYPGFLLFHMKFIFHKEAKKYKMEKRKHI